MTTTIEYLEDEQDARNTGWWIVDADDEGATHRTGPYFTRTEAARWERETSHA
jgi:hypothetical protein